MINLNQLRVFYHVAKNLSFTKAAECLFITQPAVTAHVKLFEQLCEVKLFKKMGKTITLTDEAKLLFPYAKRVFEDEMDFERALNNLRKLKSGILRIGTPKTYSRFLMPIITRRFQKKYPGIKIVMREGSSRDMMHSLLSLENEVVIVTKVEEHPEIEFHPFSEEEIVMILSPTHPFASRSSVAPHDLNGEPCILREKGSGTRKHIEDFFARNQCTPNIIMETGNSELIKQLVARGDGISFLVRVAVLNEINDKKLVPVSIQGEKIVLDAGVAYLKNQPLSCCATALIETLKELSITNGPIPGISSLYSQNR